MKPQPKLSAKQKPALSRSDVEALMSYDVKSDSPVLSVYLDTDQADAANLKRAFEVVFKNMLRNVELPEQTNKQELKDDAEVVLRFLKDYRDVARALVVFADASEDFFWNRELAVNVTNFLRWNERPFVRPLLELIDEHERYGVVLTDRSKARLFTIFLGEIEELKEAFAQANVKHIKASGRDHVLSQMNIQRKADMHARSHLKDVSKAMSRVVVSRGLNRLILGGPVESTSELFRLLPKSLQVRVVSKLALPVEANAEQVLQETLKIETDLERKHEADLVELLITAAGKKENAVVGLEQTLLALQASRVWQIVFATEFQTRGGQCTNCGALLVTVEEPCVYCGEPVRAIDDVIQFAVERVMDRDGKIEQVRGVAADRLRGVGGIGAVLHY
jgi:peptide subunit release factor 1 (eRF1)